MSDGSQHAHPYDSGWFELGSPLIAHTVALQLSYHRGLNGATPVAAVQVYGGSRGIRLNCERTTMTFGYLDGTSMAAPHVTGTAGLLFSLKPSATVTQVRNALLGSVDLLPSLAGKTVTGGRLNAWKALAALLPMDTRITGGPPASGKTTNATFNFDTGNTGNAGFQCSLDGGAFQPCTSPQSYKSLPVGQHTFSVRSAVAGGVDATPATKQWTVTKNK